MLRLGVDARHAARGLGIATFVGELTRALAPRPELELVWLGSPGSAPAGVEAHPVAGPYPRLDVLDAERTVRRHRLDAVLFAGNTGPVRPLSVPVVLTVHDLLFFDEPPPRRLRPLVGHAYSRWSVPRAIRAATAVATVSETSAADIRALAPGVDVHVVPHGIHGPAARVAEPVAEGAVVAFVARDPRKRSDLVVDAYRALAAPRPPLVLLAGAGVPPALEGPIDALRPLGDVRVVPHLPRPVVDATLASALAVIYPSEREGFGLPVLEAMALGAPVVSGLAPAVREVGGDALLPIAAEDPAGSIASAVERLRADDALRRRLADAGRARAATFSWDAAARAYATLVADAVGAAR